MISLAFTSSGLYTWLVLPLLIFLARIVDVSMGTIRILFISRGSKYLAPLIGFFEVLIWLLAIGQIIQNLSNALCYIAYAGGFAGGTYIGMLIEHKLAVGFIMVRVVTNKDASKLIDYLETAEFGVTQVAARGIKGRVRIVFTIIRRRNLNKIVGIIRQYNPNAFYSTEDIRSVSKEIFPLGRPRPRKRLLRLLRRQRKGK